MTIPCKYFKHTSRDLQLSFKRLITICISGDTYWNRLPVRMKNKFFQKLSGILLHDDLTFKIQSGTESPILMRVPGIAINTAMLTALIGIHGIHHPQIRTCYFVYDLLRAFVKDLCCWRCDQRLIQSFDVFLNILRLQELVP